MGILFISHSSRDNAQAIRVCEWLRENGWADVFLDLDPERGIAAGHHWQQELKHAGERCSGVVVLLSPNWIASRWCQTEFLLADQLGKKIFPAFIAPTSLADLPLDIRSKYQMVDISTPEKEADGFARLAIGLKRSGLDPSSFPWPPPNDPHRSIYRGLESLDEEDAAIFFGRGALITKALDTLRRMRDGAPERLLLILGASGAGKSSFLKAGMLARLKRDEENFLVFPVVRPERTALTGPHGLAASFAVDPAQIDSARNLVELFDARRATILKRIRRLARDADGPRVAPTIVIPIDQAEELFTSENSEAVRVLDLLTGAIRDDGNTLVIATIRSDAFAKLQAKPRLADISLQPFSLPTIPLGAFKEVIECPARLAEPPLMIEPALTDRLLRDLAAEDALPLLAFTLERLSQRHRHGGTLTLAEYTDRLGGIQGAITSAVDAAFAEARRDPALPQTHAEIEALARRAFIPALVQLDDADSQPRRRVEQFDALPEETQPLVRHLVNQRLLVFNRQRVDGSETDTVEVTHEAILRQWPALKAWIAEERDALRTLDSARDAAAEWNLERQRARDGEGRSWLVHRGGRLIEAEALLARPEFASVFGQTERDYVLACRNYENSELQREKYALARTRRLQRYIGAGVAATGVVVLLAGLGIMQLVAGLAAGSRDSLLTQATKDAEQHLYLPSARYALAGLAAAQWAHRGSEPVVLVEAELRSAVDESNALSILRGHKDQVLGAVFSPDGKFVATASRDRTARIWDVRTGDTIRVLRGHSAPLTGLDFSPDGKHVVTASEDRTARVWNVATGLTTVILRGHDDVVDGAVFSPDGKRILTASADKTARIWDAATGTVLVRLLGHEQTVLDAAFSRDGRLVVTTSDDKTARIWDADSGRELMTLSGHENRVNSAAFSPDGKSVVTGSDDSTARIWDVQTGKEVVKLDVGNPVKGVAFSADGSRIATASNDNSVRIWDSQSGSELTALDGHNSFVNSVAFSPDGKYVVSASDDGTARIWNAAARITVLRGHSDVINSVRFSPDGRHILTASNDKTARIWDAATGQQIRLLQGHTNLVEVAVFSRDGKTIVTGADDRTARVWDANSGRQLLTLSGNRGKIYGVSVAPDGKTIATASTDGSVRLWDATTGRVITALRAHLRAANSVEFSPDGTRIATGSDDGTAKIWTLAGAIDPLVLKHGGSVISVSFSPDGGKLVTAGSNKLAIVWDTHSGRRLLVLAGHKDTVMSAVFSPDGKRLLTASHDKTARLWDARTGALIAVLLGHSDQVENAAFSPDGTRVVTGSDDNTAQVWYVDRISSASGAALVRQICETSLAHGLSRFSDAEIRAVPVLDPALDADACHPPGLWARLGRIFLAGLRN